MVLQNTGNAKLRGLGISTVLASQVSSGVPGLTAYSCKLDNTGSALTLPQPLAAGHSLHCTATYTFSDASIIEAGNLTFTPTVSATDTSAGDIQNADALMVTVPSLPVIDVHLADATCPTTPALSAPTIGMLAGLADAAALRRATLPVPGFRTDAFTVHASLWFVLLVLLIVLAGAATMVAWPSLAGTLCMGSACVGLLPT